MALRKIGFIVFLTAILTAILANFGWAEGGDAGNSFCNQESWGQTSQKKEWDVTLGAGLRVGPRYEGSDDYVVGPMPYLNVCWRGIVSLGPMGLNVNLLRGQNYQFGAGLTYSAGRDEKGSNLFGAIDNGTDEKLRGLGDIDPALGFRAFGAYMLGPVALRASFTKYTGGDNHGTLINLGLGLPCHPMDKLTLTPGIGTTLADDNYMQTWFGVSQQQSSRSGLPTFNAGSGIKDVTAGLNATYRLDQHWFLSTDAFVKQLVGDARKSPITDASTGATFGTIIGYHF